MVLIGFLSDFSDHFSDWCKLCCQMTGSMWRKSCLPLGIKAKTSEYLFNDLFVWNLQIYNEFLLYFKIKSRINFFLFYILCYMSIDNFFWCLKMFSVRTRGTPSLFVGLFVVFFLSFLFSLLFPFFSFFLLSSFQCLSISSSRVPLSLNSILSKSHFLTPSKMWSKPFAIATLPILFLSIRNSFTVGKSSVMTPLYSLSLHKYSLFFFFFFLLFLTPFFFFLFLFSREIQAHHMCFILSLPLHESPQLLLHPQVLSLLPRFKIPMLFLNNHTKTHCKFPSLILF